MKSKTDREIAIEYVNLHTHSWYCGHGDGELATYVEVAIREGLQVLGFNEHCPMPNERWAEIRMPYSLLDTYIDECKALQKSHDDIIILTGLECDYDPAFRSWYQEHLLDSKRVDYLSLAVHYLPDSTGGEQYLQYYPSTKEYLHAYTDAYIEGLSTGLFDFGVHPDLFGSFYREWDSEALACSKAIFECSIAYNVPLELNGSGFHKPLIRTSSGERNIYPLIPFWNLAKEYPITIVTSSDAHTPATVRAHAEDALLFAKEIGLPINTSVVIDAEMKMVIKNNA